MSGKYKKPTLREKVEVYENLLHNLQINYIMGHSNRVHAILDIIDSWSYAHRSGNGEISDAEQDQRVWHVFEKMKKLNENLPPVVIGGA